MGELYQLRVPVDKLRRTVASEDVPPEVEDYLKQIRNADVVVDPDEGEWELHITTETSPPDDLEDHLFRCFQPEVDGLKTLRIVTRNPDGESLDAWVQQNWESLKTYLASHSPLSKSVFEYARPRCQNGELVIELADRRWTNICQDREFGPRIKSWVQRSRGEAPSVRFVTGDFQDTIQEDAEVFEKQQVEKLDKARRRREVRTKKETQDVVVGRRIKTEPTPIKDIETGNGSNSLTVQGQIITSEFITTSGGKKNLVSGIITDRTDSLAFKQFTDQDRSDLAGLRGDWVTIRGSLRTDSFNRSGDVVLFVDDVNRIPPLIREDNVADKRVEFHCHTNMSQLDALPDVEDLVQRAAYWGHSALAITDHGVVHSFPEAARAGEKYGVKIIYGVEGYLVQDERPLVLNVGDEDEGVRFDRDVVVLDCETSGVSPHTDEVFQVAAARVEGDEIVDRFTRLMPVDDIPERILERSPVSREALADAPAAETVIQDLQEFVGDRPLVIYDGDYVRHFLQNRSFRFSRPILHLRRLVEEVWDPPVTELNDFARERFGAHSKHKFDAEADVTRTVQILNEIPEVLDDGLTVEALGDLQNRSDFKKASLNHIILLARNRTGLRNLYELISKSHVDYFYRKPRMLRSVINEHREGLLVGSACEMGEIFQRVLRGDSDEEVKERMKFYDLIEVQPVENNRFMLKRGGAYQGISSEEDIEEIFRTIYRLGSELGKPVIGTGDVHFMDPEDESLRRILQAGQDYEEADTQPPLYYRTTDEMLDRFDFLGEDAAIEVASENPRNVADLCEELQPIPDGFYPPTVEGAREEFLDTIRERVRELYGETLPEPVGQRLEKEKDAILENQFADLYVMASRLVQKSLNDDYLVGSRGSVGSSFTAFLMQITEVNPLPAHYRCGSCGYCEFPEDSEADVGVDLPERDCPDCGETMNRDGFNIPFEVFCGFEGDKIPDIDLNFSGEYQQEMFRYVEELFGEENVFRAGTIDTIAERTAAGFVNGYIQERELNKRQAERERLKQGLTGVKQNTSQHPGGMIVVPEDHSIYEFTPINYPANDRDSNFLTTHFDYHAMEEQLIKLDILGHEDPTQLRHLQELTGVNPTTVPLDDEDTLRMFSDISVLDIDGEQLDMDTGVLGVPEFNTSFVRGMVEQTRPKTFADLLRISGLSHGTDVWLGNARDLIEQGTASLDTVISARDDIMNTLIEHGMPEQMAFQIMEDVRKGRGLDEDQVRRMKAHKVPDWYVESCQRIKYLFPKAHAAAYVIMAFRIAYYKVHHPAAFYASYFTLKTRHVDARHIGSLSQVDSRMRELQEIVDRNEDTQRDRSEYSALEVMKEAYLRGISFKQPRLGRSDPREFLIESEDVLRAPFVTIESLGGRVAESVHEAYRSRPFSSVEDAVNRTRLNKGVVENAREVGFFEGIPETENHDLFEAR